YASALDLAEDLRCFLDGKPIRARPVGRVEQMVRWCRRHPAAAVALLTLVVAVVVSTLFGVLAEQRRAIAEEQTKAALREQANLTLHQGRMFGEQGEIAQGLLWLVRGLDLAIQAEAPELERAVRENLARWSPLLHRPVRAFSHPKAIRAVVF